MRCTADSPFNPTVGNKAEEHSAFMVRLHGIEPYPLPLQGSVLTFNTRDTYLVHSVGVEPTFYGLRGRCSPIELAVHIGGPLGTRTQISVLKRRVC